MKKFVYPAVLNVKKEENLFALTFPDLDLFFTGNSVEDVYLRAAENLQSYFEFVQKFEYDIDEATSFDDAEKMNPKRKVLLLHALVKDENIKLTPQEHQYRNFIRNMIE